MELSIREVCEVCGAEPLHGEAWCSFSRWRVVKTPAGHGGTDPEGAIVGHVRCVADRVRELIRTETLSA